ncbi:hypothetical protein COT29_00775 [Candidatus Micrarchaeota archaeon CG08_land_8_20_14_0_20_59_11]|nr:MAG: hypothetical protein COT29_00775 [Candidatus Micrarchaeota archaeon CG08_land_8_20_14_0_20_59_11]PIT85658.1 MAG: hypothetical protein COU36_01980 [Candidatus Micrarchaeota archaeon CG10_big_fil_rev_8_21_14_0_10_59_7]
MVADEEKVFKPVEEKRKEKEAEEGKPVEEEKTAEDKGKRVKPEHREEKKGEKKEGEEKKREIVLQRLYVVDLSEAFRKPEPRHQRSAVRLLRQFVSKHMKSAKIRIAPELAAEAAKSRRLRISATKDKEGLVLVGRIQQDAASETTLQ